MCELSADGTTAERAASSCLTVLDTFPASASGVYWLLGGKKTNTKPFQAVCDMTSDGGGWTSIGVVGTSLSKRALTTMDYTRGINSVDGGDAAEFVLPCENLNGLDGDSDSPLLRFVIRVSMGSIRDYYRPIPGKSTVSLCYLLTHRDSFQWSPNAGGMGSTLSTRASALLTGNTWVQPMYNTGPKELGVLGGSNQTWPKGIDDREYLSMWGSAQAPGGCCHYTSKLYTRDVEREGHGEADAGGWGKQFRVDVIELPEVQDASDDPLEIVEEDQSDGEQSEDDTSIKSKNEEIKSLLKQELTGEEQQAVVNKEAAAKERETDFEGLDELFSDYKR